MIRGDAGKAIGSGMKDGLIVVHGDVGSDPGTGMTGGKIVINGRCPSPPPDVELRPLKPAELKEINALFSDEDQKVPSDAVCLTSAKKQRHTPVKTSEGDYSTLILIGEENHPCSLEHVTPLPSLEKERAEEMHLHYQSLSYHMFQAA